MPHRESATLDVEPTMIGLGIVHGKAILEQRSDPIH